MWLSKCSNILRNDSEAQKLRRSSRWKNQSGEPGCGILMSSNPVAGGGGGTGWDVSWLMDRRAQPPLCQLCTYHQKGAILILIAFGEEGVSGNNQVLTYKQVPSFRNRMPIDRQELWGQNQIGLVSAAWRWCAFILYPYWQNVKVQQAKTITYVAHSRWVSRLLVIFCLVFLTESLMSNDWSYYPQEEDLVG